ncbi:MAG: DUF4352 domain-containing protein, partial [Trebonia sp.]
RRRRGCLYAFLGVAGGIVLLVVVIVVIVAVAASNNGPTTGTTTPTAASGSSSSGSAHAAGIGSKVRDGKFQFTITRITHARRVGSSVLGQKAQGEFTVLHVTVTNIGSVSQSLDDSAQYVYDSRGRKYNADSTADLYINGSSNSVFLNDINPGNTVHGKIAFDLPRGDHAVRAERHDSLLSGGVTVCLTS